MCFFIYALRMIFDLCHFWRAPKIVFKGQKSKKKLFLCAFTELRKATIRYVCLSACPFTRMEQLSCHWTDFNEIWYM